MIQNIPTSAATRLILHNHFNCLRQTGIPPNLHNYWRTHPSDDFCTPIITLFDGPNYYSIVLLRNCTIHLLCWYFRNTLAGQPEPHTPLNINTFLYLKIIRYRQASTRRQFERSQFHCGQLFPRTQKTPQQFRTTPWTLQVLFVITKHLREDPKLTMRGLLELIHFYIFKRNNPPSHITCYLHTSPDWHHNCRL